MIIGHSKQVVFTFACCNNIIPYNSVVLCSFLMGWGGMLVESYSAPAIELDTTFTIHCGSTTC